MNAPERFVNDQSVVAWRAWLSGLSDELPGHRLTRFGTHFATPCEELLPELGRVLRQDSSLFDWMFPADRYAGEEGSPSLRGDDFDQLMSTWGMDRRLRVHYVCFLGLLGATTDHHGWVLEDARPDVEVRWQLPSLNTAQTLAIARVLRMLHLAGWRGYSRSNVPDPHAYWYDLGLQSWLLARWNTECREHAFPKPWLEALDGYALPVGTRCNFRRPRERAFSMNEDSPFSRWGGVTDLQAL